MEEGESIRIQQIMSQTKCDNNFQCCEIGSQSRCKAKIVCDGRLLDCSKCGPSNCLRQSSDGCNYHTSFGSGFFCTCPLRIYLAQNPDALLKRAYSHPALNRPQTR